MRKKTRVRLLFAAHLVLALAAGVHVYHHSMEAAIQPAVGEQLQIDESSAGIQHGNAAQPRSKESQESATLSILPDGSQIEQRAFPASMAVRFWPNANAGFLAVVATPKADLIVFAILWMEFICYTAIAMSEVFPEKESRGQSESQQESFLTDDQSG